MPPSFFIAIEGTLVLWLFSGALACLFGLTLAAGSLSGYRLVRAVSRSVIDVTRGVPTSLFVIAAGITLLRLPAAGQMPNIFPGTPDGFQHLAWGIMLALALGSAGHLAEIFRAARTSLGHSRLHQATVLGLRSSRRAALLAREAAVVALPPTSTRLIHHLHNTAFAALFPVTDFFGFIQAQANATFRVLDFALLGCAVYVAISALIWLIFRAVEAILQHRVVRVRRIKAVVA
jgi:ABC-type amino acid transport system permease subunit